MDSYVLNGTSVTETEFSDKVSEIFGETVDAFDGVRLGLFQKGTETLLLEINTFNSLEFKHLHQHRQYFQVIQLLHYWLMVFQNYLLYLMFIIMIQ